jgi:hypothetical protein
MEIPGTKLKEKMIPKSRARVDQAVWEAIKELPLDMNCGTPRSLLRFTRKTQKNRRSGDFLPCKLRRTKGTQEPINRDFLRH